MAAFSTIAAIGLGAAGVAATVHSGNRAAAAVESSATTSDATSRYIYEDVKMRNAYREELGNAALGDIEQLYSGDNEDAINKFYNSPDYKLAFNEGQRAIEGGAAARGGLLSGDTAKAVTGFGQNLATSTFGNYKNSLNNIAGMGQQANQAITNAGQSYAAQFGASQAQVGAANAAAAQNTGNVIGGVLTGFGQGLLG